MNVYHAIHCWECLLFFWSVFGQKSSKNNVVKELSMCHAPFSHAYSVFMVNAELPVIGKPNWYYLTLVSPYAGIYYWKKGDRVDQCSVKLQTNEEETENEIVVQGSEEELDRMWRTLGWREKGMVKVEGLLKQYQ